MAAFKFIYMKNAISTLLTTATVGAAGCGHLHYDNGNPPGLLTPAEQATHLVAAADVMDVPESVALRVELDGVQFGIDRQLSQHHLQAWIAGIQETCGSAWFDLTMPAGDMDVQDCRGLLPTDQEIVDPDAAYSSGVLDADFDCLRAAIGKTEFPTGTDDDGVTYGWFPGCTAVMMPVTETQYILTSSCSTADGTEPSMAVESHDSYCR